MGVDTKAIIRKDVTLVMIKEALEQEYQCKASIEPTHIEYFFTITFSVHGENRWLSVFLTGVSKHDYGIDGVLLSLSATGFAVEVMTFLCKKFGGYLDENDCDSKEFEAFNLELFESAKNITPRDELTNEIISKLGYENLSKALALFEKYKGIV